MMFTAHTKTFPTPAELAELDRDLTFRPSTTQEPGVLTRDQIDQYNELGYLHGIRIFDTDEITDLRRYFDRILEAEIHRGGSSYTLVSAHMKHGRLYDLQRHPRILPYLNDLLGPDIISWGAQFFCKIAGDEKTISWHQDASYWPLTPSRTATVWLAVDDVDTENACMQFIAGSHRHGHIDFRASDEAEQNVLNQTVEEPERYGSVVDVELKAGEVSIHSDLLLHGSQANHSTRRRCGLTLRYCTPDVSGGFGWMKEGSIVSGEDRFGHWVKLARPEIE